MKALQRLLEEIQLSVKGEKSSCMMSNISDAGNKELVSKHFASMHMLIWHVMHLQLATEFLHTAKILRLQVAIGCCYVLAEWQLFNPYFSC